MPVTPRCLSIDEVLEMVGEYGCFQKILTLLCCIIMIPTSMQAIIMVFVIDNPPWRCNISNATTNCNKWNETFPSTDNSRCNMPRTDWTYITPRGHSIVTQFDLVCERAYLIDIAVSIQYFGFIFGAAFLSWCTDNFGRRRVHFISLAIVFLCGFLNIFVSNVYLFIACRFFIGFFLHGTYPQLNLMLSEIVGNQHRAFCSNMTYFACGAAFAILALKAYLLQHHGWKVLFLVCTAPYTIVMFFYFFIPESVRYLKVKGKTECAMTVFRRAAYWNKSDLPDDVVISSLEIDQQATSEASRNTQTTKATSTTKVTTKTITKSSPIDLFRGRRMALTSIILGSSSLTNAMTFYCVYLAAGDISGHMYRDFMLISIIDVPVAIATTPLVNKYGRKHVTMLYMLIASVACLGLGVTPSSGTWRTLRVFLGLTGKMCNVGATMARAVWALELYPTHIRAESIGLAQVLNKIGATSSSWIAKDLNGLYSGAAFLLIGAIGFVSFCFHPLLPDTLGVETADTQRELERQSHGEGIESSDNEREMRSYTNDDFQV